jgi:hypothetical protein
LFAGDHVLDGFHFRICSRLPDLSRGKRLAHVVQHADRHLRRNPFRTHHTSCSGQTSYIIDQKNNFIALVSFKFLVFFTLWYLSLV